MDLTEQTGPNDVRTSTGGSASTAARLVGLGLIGAVTGPMALRLGFVALLGATVLFAVLPILVAVTAVAVAFVVRLTDDPDAAGRRRRTSPGLVTWLVLGGFTGEALVLTVWYQTLATPVSAALSWSHAPALVVSLVLPLLCAIGFVLPAVLHRPGLPRVVGALVTVALVATVGAGVLDRAAQERARERAERADRLGPRDLLYVTEVRGYTVTSLASGRVDLTPVDQSVSAVWQDHDIWFTVSNDPVELPGCGPSPLPGPEPFPADPQATGPAGQDSITCRPVRPGLWYRTSTTRHEYVMQKDGHVLRSGGGRDVAPETLLAALTAARPLKDSELDAYLPSGD